PGARRPESGQDGLPRREDPCRGAARGKGRRGDRHRRGPGDSRKHGGAGDGGASPSEARRLRKMTTGAVGLRLREIRKSFGATRALRSVSLEVATGEVHALIGENGAGKSTLMKILSGAHRADGGTMELGGVPYAPDA